MRAMHVVAATIFGNGRSAIGARLGLTRGIFALQQLLKARIGLRILAFPFFQLGLSLTRGAHLAQHVLARVIVGRSNHAAA